MPLSRISRAICAAIFLSDEKCGSLINVPALCISITTFLGDVLFHILQKAKIETKIATKIARVAAA